MFLTLLAVVSAIVGGLQAAGVGASEEEGAQEAKLGDIYVANISGSTVTRYDGMTGAYRGVFVEAGAGGLNGPTGLAFGPDGHLYVSSSQTDQVLRYDGDTGEFLDVFVADPALDMPFSLIFGPGGDLYVSSGATGRVLRYEGATGAPKGVAADDEQLKQPIGLRSGSDGTLFVANSTERNVLRFDPASGESLGVFASGELRFPSDVAFGPDGDLYVSSAGSASVLRFDGLTGEPAGVAARLPEGSAPVGLDFTLDGRLIVGDFAGNRLFIVPLDGGPPKLVSDEGLAGPENLVVRRPVPPVSPDDAAETGSRAVETVVQTEVGFYQEISWRPDGSGLLVSVLEWGSGPDGFAYRIYEIGVDGSGFRPLTDGPRDRWTSPSPDGSRIAFASMQSENDDIYTMAADGSDWLRLTDDPAVDSHPRFSPDGARIAFISRREGEAEVYIMNADGTGQTRLIEAGGEPNNPTWSPDGSRLAFFATDAQGIDHIWVVGADGTTAKRVGTGLWPSWSADGSKVLYGAEGGIYEVDPAGGSSSLVLPGEASFARVSPDGSRIGYIESDSVEVSIHIARLDGSEHSVLLRRPKPAW